VDERERREHVLERLRRTGRNETVCLMDWEARLIVEWIEEKGGNGNEQADDHRKPDR
jgi:hypothetical protein